MLKELHLTNFRQHEDRTFTFTEGLNVVRGANEGGKTTILEGFGYLLGGVKSCREPLAKVVTWGKGEKTLAAEGRIVFDGVEYHVKRSPRGAEVNYEGGRTVGQTEVTRFFENLFGCDMALMSHLMMSSQGSIRGALETGSKETMKLIEGLADFAIVDRVIELITTHLLTGPTKTVEDRAAQAELAVNAAEKALVEPDTSEQDTRLAEIRAELSRLQPKIDTDLKPAAAVADAAAEKAHRAAQERLGFIVQAEQREKDRTARSQQLKQAAATAGTDEIIDQIEEQIRAKRLEITNGETAAAEVAVYRQFAALAYPEQHWEGDQASFELEQSRLATARAEHGRVIREHETAIVRAEADIRVLEAMRVTGTACGLCGKDVSAVPEVVSKNTLLDEQLAMKRGFLKAQRALLDAMQRTALEAADEALALEAVQKSAKPFLDFLARYGDRVASGGAAKSFPPRFFWKGPEPRPYGDGVKTQIELANLERKLKDMYEAAGRALELARGIEEDDKQIVALRLKARALDNEANKVEELDRARADAARAWNEASGRVAELRYELEKIQAGVAAAKAVYEAGKRGVEASKASLDKAKADLASLQFNNALLKRVKEARPEIADKLWAIVLSTVSGYFSAMRGRTSVVSRAGDEFLVDGKSIEGLSGSTLDVLGLAIRVALTRTFLPNTSMFVLDEPAAAMDDERTASTMGFIQASGFAQTIVVTHEDATESVAQNLITI